ncbi:ABC transporter permease [Deminuibacter soli]|uniref:ABC transporter permease n=1 Tax=Deminuibacter soli TaxID=2291815 RepID=A0A3E1NEC2_9BACT|nr:ABC transporter permease [Deminuibacter soli]RFM26319.1 ABC transporter permease [Deminuibacter soli]
MFRNYLKTAWRSLLKNRFYSLLNISGLTVGLAVGMLILLWVQNEMSYDRFHAKASNIYSLQNMVGTGTSRQIWTVTTAPIAEMAKKELPEVKDMVRLTGNGWYSQFTYKDKVFQATNCSFTDPSYFTVFDFKLLKGQQSTVFADPHSIVMSAGTAKKYFGDEDPIGKVIKADDPNQTPFTVTGVMMDYPENSTIKNDLLLPMSLRAQLGYANNKEGRTIYNDFIQFNYTTFLLLRDNVNLGKLSTQLRNIHLRNKADDTDIEYLLNPISKLHLYRADGSDGGIDTVRLFGIIALLILVIACINYVNLSTARSMLRAREVSMRKIVGAARMQLFIQFVAETTLLFLFATVFAVVLMYLLLPGFNYISGQTLAMHFNNYHMWLVIGCTVCGTVAASSIYPAILLSSFEPLKALKGKISARIGDVLFRKILVVTQFAVSVILITGTFIISKQLAYIHNKQLGFDKTNVFALYMRGMNQHYDAVKADLLKQPGVLDVTRAMDNVVDLNNQTGDNAWDGKGPTETMMMYPLAIDHNFIPFFNMQLLEGKNFSGTPGDSTHFILNETAVRNAGIKSPIGKRFRLWKTEGTIIGVVKDFHFASLKEKIEPSIFFYSPSSASFLYVKTNGTGATAAIAAVEQQWKQYNAKYPFQYAFLDETFNKLYSNEQRTGSLFQVFAGIAILISCLGLFGLAAYTAQVRTREIGVRKVLGATVTMIVQLLVKDFIQLVLLAIVIATPVAWYIMHNWLHHFAYQTNISWVVFLISGAIAVFIAIATIGFQSVKAALANPARSLKTGE